METLVRVLGFSALSSFFERVDQFRNSSSEYGISSNQLLTSSLTDWLHKVNKSHEKNVFNFHDDFDFKLIGIIGFPFFYFRVVAVTPGLCVWIKRLTRGRKHHVSRDPKRLYGTLRTVYFCGGKICFLTMKFKMGFKKNIFWTSPTSKVGPGRQNLTLFTIKYQTEYDTLTTKITGNFIL